MPAARPQAISGVSAGVENTVMTVYPSLAATGPGQLFGRILHSIPLRINGIMLSTLLFGLPIGGLALAFYAMQKVFGDRYVLTNRAIQSWKAIGQQLVGQAPLVDVDSIRIDRPAGYKFYHAGDLVLLAKDGSVLLRLNGVPRPDVFRQIILEARDARRQVEASLATIRARAGSAA